MISFRKEDRGRVASGEITVTFRLWERARVTAGKQYRVGFGTIAVDDVRVMPAGLVTEDDVAPSGLDSIEAIWASAGDHKKAVVTPETLLYRVAFRFVTDA